MGIRSKKTAKLVEWACSALIIIGIGFFSYKIVTNRPSYNTGEVASTNIFLFDSSLSQNEQSKIRQAIENQNIEVNGSLTVTARYALSTTEPKQLLETLVPVTHFNSARQSVDVSELPSLPIIIPRDTDKNQKSAIEQALGVPQNYTSTLTELSEITPNDIAFLPLSELSSSVKLLGFEGNYFLDSFVSGALFREVTFEGESAELLSTLEISEPLTKDAVYKINTTGVTALTRVIMRRHSSIGDPLYFSNKIGDFLADADLTHVSNEVSFKEPCDYNNVLFCSPPEFIETLKASGVDLVEITGNHNNDFGAEANAQTIANYRALGWGVVGGGLDTTDAAKPYLIDSKSSKIAFLAYNDADGPGSGALAKQSSAGANAYDETKAKRDIEGLKAQGYFVMVHVQYLECYAYPNGYDEYPQCDVPIGKQEERFKKIIDMGADMVVGSSAHQPQTYELYNGKPIYYGLGNMFFEQTSWPGTERGLVLSHYFARGKYLQTKITPTRYDKDLQPRLMNEDESAFLLNRLAQARDN